MSKGRFCGLPVDVCVGLFLSDNAGYAVEGIEHLGAGAADVETETALISVSTTSVVRSTAVAHAECGAVVHHNPRFLYEMLRQRFMRYSVGGEVEPGEVGGLGEDGLDFGEVLLEVFVECLNVRVQIFQHLALPFLAVGEGGFGGGEGEDVASGHAQGVEPAEEAVAQCCIGDATH